MTVLFLFLILQGYGMSRQERVELTAMYMVYDDHGNVLVEDRRKQDWPGATFPGGHVEPGESMEMV